MDNEIQTEKKIGGMYFSIPYKNVMAALTEAVSQIESATKDATNPAFKSPYATLPSCIDAVKPVLTKNGLALLQVPSVGEDSKTVTISSIVTHGKSGEYCHWEMSMTAADTKPQTIGSTITYLRRYALPGLGLVTEIDDDGNAYSGVGPQQRQSSRPAAQPPKPVEQPKEQATPKADGDFDPFFKSAANEALFNEYLKQYNLERQRVNFKGWLAQKGVADLPEAEFGTVLKAVKHNRDYEKVISNYSLFQPSIRLVDALTEAFKHPGGPLKYVEEKAAQRQSPAKE